jgi:AICAR transformylase/IMP cyclohydrolase PurH
MNLDGSLCAFDGPIKDIEVVNHVIGTGIKTIIEPGGVKEDRIVKKQLEENGIELIFSGRRRYKIS